MVFRRDVSCAHLAGASGKPRVFRIPEKINGSRNDLVKELIALEIEFVSSKNLAASFVDGPEDDERFSVHSTIDLILVVLKVKKATFLFSSIQRPFWAFPD